jgi:hypothetical protein
LERSFTALGPGGGSLAVLVNSDVRPYVGQIISAVGQHLVRHQIDLVARR